MSRSVSRCTSTSKNGISYINGEGNAVVSPRRSWTRGICARWVVMCASVCLATVLLLERHPWHIGQPVLEIVSCHRDHRRSNCSIGLDSFPACCAVIRCDSICVSTSVRFLELSGLYNSRARADQKLTRIRVVLCPSSRGVEQ